MADVDLRWGAWDTLDVDGVRLHVESAGPRDAAGLVALHGFASGTFTWAGIAPDLAAHHNVVAYDRPPFGRSGRPRPAPGTADPYALPAQLAQLTAVVRRGVGDLSPQVVVGHSAGALLAVQAVVAGCLAPRLLVLIAPAVEGGPPGVIRRLARAPGAALVGPAALRVGLRGSATVLRTTGRHRTPLLDATAAETGRHLRAPGTARALWHLTTSWEPPQLTERLDSVTVPTVVIGGAEDRIVPPRAQAALAERLGATHHVLDGVGHAPHEQVPERVVAFVRAAIERT